MFLCCLLCCVLCYAHIAQSPGACGLLNSICSLQAVAFTKFCVLFIISQMHNTVISCLHLVIPSFLLVLVFKSDDMSGKVFYHSVLNLLCSEQFCKTELVVLKQQMNSNHVNNKMSVRVVYSVELHINVLKLMLSSADWLTF